MKQRQLLISLALFSATAMMAQTLPDGMVALLPEGVTPNITNTVASGKGTTTQERPHKEKNITVAGSEEKGYKVFFSATDTEHGEELWVSDGTAAGTHLVKDLRPGTAGSEIAYITRFNDKVVFRANDGSHGLELWISDGTEDGTYLVKDIREGSYNSTPLGFTQLNETQFVFAAYENKAALTEVQGRVGNNDDVKFWPQRLYVSDGTAEGTKMINYDYARWPGVSNPQVCQTTPWMRVGRKVFFKAIDVDFKYNEELYVTDGTEEGTHRVKDILPGTGCPFINNCVNYYNEGLIFSAWYTNRGHEYWYTDGTEANTHLLCEIRPTVSDGCGSLPGAEPYNGKIFTRGMTAEYGNELAIIDVDKCLTNPIFDPINHATEYNSDCIDIVDMNLIEPTSANGSAPTYFVMHHGKLFSQVNGGIADGYVGGELFMIDVEAKTAQCYFDLRAGKACTWPKGIMTCGGSLYFFEGSYVNKNGDGVVVDKGVSSLWRVDDPTEGIIHRVTNFDATNGDNIHTLRDMNGTLVFASGRTNQIYAYNYQSPYYNEATDTPNMAIEYRTRQQIKDDLTAVGNVTAENAAVKVVLNAKQVAKAITSLKVNGMKVYSLQGMLVAAVNADEVDLSALAAGVYLVDVATEAGNTTVKLLKK